MGANDSNSPVELFREWIRGNPEIGASDPTGATTILRGTTIVGSIPIDQAYGGTTWRMTLYTDASSNTVAISTVTTV